MGKIKGAIVVNTERCKGCQLCIVACPQDVIGLAQKKVNVHGCSLCVEACPQNVIALAKKVNKSGYPFVEVVSQDNCVGCASCAIVCPDGCITVYRKKMED